jgi:hypothetical protein
MTDNNKTSDMSPELAASSTLQVMAAIYLRTDIANINWHNLQERIIAMQRNFLSSHCPNPKKKKKKLVTVQTSLCGQGKNTVCRHSVLPTKAHNSSESH